MRVAGIIGGLGPETTSEFYLEVVFGCYARNKEARPPILIWNVPLRYSIEKDLLTKAKGEERYLPYLIDAAKRLESAGADFLGMPCNTLHIFIEQIRHSVRIPVLSIVEETAAFLRRRKIRKVGLLATSASLKAGLYHDALEREGIGVKVPDGFSQAKIGKMVTNIVLSRHANKDREELLGIINSFGEHGAKHVILACTDLQLLIPHHPKLEIYDTMKIFADATVREILR